MHMLLLVRQPAAMFSNTLSFGVVGLISALYNRKTCTHASDQNSMHLISYTTQCK